MRYRGVTRVLAKELGTHNITANLIQPGTVDTSLVGLDELAVEEDQTREELEAEIASTKILG